MDVIRARLGLLLLLGCWTCGAGAAAKDAAADDGTATAAREGPAKPRLDHSGKKRRGKASYYGRKLYGKKMADGTPMKPESNAAASKTLPLGTKARVKNLKTGKSADVEIRDRGPYVKDRIIDVTPHTAKTLGLGKDGVAPVEVTPLEVPQPDGSVKQVPGKQGAGK